MPRLIGHGGQRVENDAGNQPVNPRLNPGTCNNQSVTLDSAPVGGVANKEEMRHAVRPTVVVPVGPELQPLAESDLGVGMLELVLVAETLLGENDGRHVRVGTVGENQLPDVLDDTRYQNDHMKVVPFRMEKPL